MPGEEITFDANIEAQGTDFFSLGAFSISRTATGWSTVSITSAMNDTRCGSRTFGPANFDDEIPGTAGGAVWSLDARHVFYPTVDDAWRPDTVWRHDIGAAPTTSKVFHEPDERWGGYRHHTQSDKYLIIGVSSKITSEAYILDSTGSDRRIP